MSALPYGTIIRSLYDAKILGPIVGYGTIKWPTTPECVGDRLMEPVYLVRIGVASSSLGPACSVIRMDHAERVDQ